jgi:hypothetical protein
MPQDVLDWVMNYPKGACSPPPSTNPNHQQETVLSAALAHKNEEYFTYEYGPSSPFSSPNVLL